MSLVPPEVGRYTYPRSSSALIIDHTLPAPVYAYESFSHVSTPGSPACGTMWKVQRNLPVWMSYARTSPGGPSLFLAESCSSIDDPMTTTSRTTRGTPLQRKAFISGPRPTLRSTFPPSPKSAYGCPFFGLSAKRYWARVVKMRASAPWLQYATPQCAPPPSKPSVPGARGGCVHNGRPVAGSMASTRPRASGAYSTPPTMMGDAVNLLEMRSSGLAERIAGSTCGLRHTTR